MTIQGQKTYVIKSKSDGLLKIGKSLNPEARLKQLGGAKRLELVEVFRLDRERELHVALADYRTSRGEWFNTTLSKITMTYHKILAKEITELFKNSCHR